MVAEDGHIQKFKAPGLAQVGKGSIRDELLISLQGLMDGIGDFGVVGKWGAEGYPAPSSGQARHSRGYGHFYEHEGTRNPETEAAEHGHHLLGEEQEAS